MALGSTGTHPLSDYREQHIIDTEHYRRVEDGLKYVAWRNNTFSLHVHVGVQRRRPRRARSATGCGPVLPMLLAISANSPYVDGMRLRPAHRAHADVHEVVPALRRAGRVRLLAGVGATTSSCSCARSSIVEFTQLWWSVRPHHDFGTVEVRICDAQTTAQEADQLAALIVACVRRAAEEIDAGETPPEVPGRLIEENMWRAIRYGLDGDLLDLARRADRALSRRRRRWTG